MGGRCDVSARRKRGQKKAWRLMMRELLELAAERMRMTGEAPAVGSCSSCLELVVFDTHELGRQWEAKHLAEGHKCWVQYLPMPSHFCVPQLHELSAN